MNREQYLLVCLSEECAEVQQAISKSLRFGLDNFHPISKKTNHIDICNELNDVIAVVTLLIREGLLDFEIINNIEDSVNKTEKIEKWMKNSTEQGILDENNY
ncbi:MAG: hypothetical protein JKY28_05265 [Sulfurimonas sp.]|nr:hypothetical protein [Sulfurimonas sp.]PHQ88499.1 MAG: hypothetical protein COB42_08740 [Sulfurimonas sp.]PHQ89533.1 MAG: hypothetical protein COB42_06830 [Sulfurimonas sp.]